MDRYAFAADVIAAVPKAIYDFSKAHPNEHPYAFSLISGQVGQYVGFAIATEEGLRKHARSYEQLGYRYDSYDWEDTDHSEKLAVWLRWALPDDGWQYGDLPGSSKLSREYDDIFLQEGWDDDDGSTEAFFSDEVLVPLTRSDAWLQNRLLASLAVGFGYGNDTYGFLRTATRSNPYPIVHQLWVEFWQARELDRRIIKPDGRRGG